MRTNERNRQSNNVCVRVCARSIQWWQFRFRKMRLNHSDDFLKGQMMEKEDWHEAMDKKIKHNIESVWESAVHHHHNLDRRRCR